mmetsp:Transcript_38102/g.70286  ORF Transcript_38102/g.70286 Transcript_38102/m.70286 type:complete len:207 (+) Transcript_38102:98-718(+)
MPCVAICAPPSLLPSHSSQCRLRSSAASWASAQGSFLLPSPLRLSRCRRLEKLHLPFAPQRLGVFRPMRLWQIPPRDMPRKAQLQLQVFRRGSPWHILPRSAGGRGHRCRGKELHRICPWKESRRQRTASKGGAGAQRQQTHPRSMLHGGEADHGNQDVMLKRGPSVGVKRRRPMAGPGRRQVRGRRRSSAGCTPSWKTSIGISWR